MVVAVRSAAGEGIAEPEAAVERDGVGDIGKARGALVGGDHEIGVLPIVDDDAVGMDDLVLDDVVGDRQKRANENAIAFGSLGNPRIAVGGAGQMLGIEA